MSSSGLQRCPKCGGTCRSHAERNHLERLSFLAGDAMRLAKALGRYLDAAVIAGIGALFQMTRRQKFQCEQCDHQFVRLTGEQVGDSDLDRAAR